MGALAHCAKGCVAHWEEFKPQLTWIWSCRGCSLSPDRWMISIYCLYPKKLPQLPFQLPFLGFGATPCPINANFRWHSPGPRWSCWTAGQARAAPAPAPCQSREPGIWSPEVLATAAKRLVKWNGLWILMNFGLLLAMFSQNKCVFSLLLKQLSSISHSNAAHLSFFPTNGICLLHRSASCCQVTKALCHKN